MVDQASIDDGAVFLGGRRKLPDTGRRDDGAAGPSEALDPPSIHRGTIESVGIRAFLLGLALLVFAVLMEILAAAEPAASRESLTLLFGYQYQ